MLDDLTARGLISVVPHTGDVDRNAEDADAIDAQDVVPHTGDVDRNTTFVISV